MTSPVNRNYQAHHIEIAVKYYEKQGYTNFKVKKLDDKWYSVKPVEKTTAELWIKTQKYASKPTEDDELIQMLKNITDLTNGQIQQMSE